MDDIEFLRTGWHLHKHIPHMCISDKHSNNVYMLSFFLPILVEQGHYADDRVIFVFTFFGDFSQQENFTHWLWKHVLSEPLSKWKIVIFNQKSNIARRLIKSSNIFLNVNKSGKFDKSGLKSTKLTVFIEYHSKVMRFFLHTNNFSVENQST